MRVIDGFLYNGEIEILLFRLELHDKYVDEFVIIESYKTFTGLIKKDTLDINDEKLKKFNEKIRYVLVENELMYNSAWNMEYYLRQQILINLNANDSDLVIISDVDEIINFESVYPKINNKIFQFIELSCFYYFLNLISTEKICVTIIGPYSIIKNRDIGNRNLYNEFIYSTINDSDASNGGHFTYQFGYKIGDYQRKIKSFSHQELNNDYFLDSNRIFKCIFYEVDIFDRWKFDYKTINLSTKFPRLYQSIVLNNNSRELLKSTNFIFKLKKILYKITNRGYLRYNYYLTLHYIKTRFYDKIR